MISAYQFAGGVSPATTPRAALPVLPQAAYGLACDLFDEIAAAAGLTAVKESGRQPGPYAQCFELDADTKIETHDHGVMTVAELERFIRERRPHGGAATLRCSGRFHDRTRARTDSASHQLGPPRPRHLRHDDGNDLAPARAGAVRAVRIFGSIASKEPVPMNKHSTPKAGLDTFDGDASSRADREFLASLSDHPLVQHPLYSMPPPPRPNYEGCITIDAGAEADQLYRSTRRR